MKYSDYFLLFKRLLLAFSLYPIIRILFVFFNNDLFVNVPTLEICLSLLYGIRFDIATLLIVNSPFIFLSFIPLKNKFYQVFIHFIFVVSNVIALGLSVVDFEFFKFNGKRMTLGIFGIATDMADQGIQIIFYYWYYAIINVLVFGYYLYLYPRTKRNDNKSLAIWKVVVFDFLILIVSFIGIRGGLQLRSISPKSAFIFEHIESGQASLNSAYTFIRSLNQKQLKPIKYFKKDQEAIQIIKKEKDFGSSSLNLGKKNIIFLVVESLSQEYLDEGYTPFLSKIAEKGIYIDQGFANGRRSIEALPSILTGMPSLLKKPLYQSSFQTNYFESLPMILKRFGYNTSFYHGGKTGTMDFDAYTKSIGISKYFGKENYPNQEHYDGNWGIFDHYFINWFGSQLNKTKEPFFTTLFTLSSHQPYTIPSEFKGKFPKGTLEIHESMGYADKSLELFFEKYKNEKWFNNSIFIITGDHTQKRESKKYLNALGQFRIPFIIFTPGDTINSDLTPIMQQADILATVLDLVGIKQDKSLLYGCSIFSDCHHIVFNRIGDEYFLIKYPYVVFSRDENYDIFRLNENLTEMTKNASKEHFELIRLFKAYKQYSINGLINNSLYE